MYTSREEYIAALQQERANGYRIWGYEIQDYVMISGSEAAVLVTYSYSTPYERVSSAAEWWRLIKVNYVWKVAWMPRKR